MSEIKIYRKRENIKIGFGAGKIMGKTRSYLDQREYRNKNIWQRRMRAKRSGEDNSTREARRGKIFKG